MSKVVFVFLCLILGSISPGFSQEVILPNIEVVMAAALEYSPLVKTQEASIHGQEAELKRNGKLWLQSLQLQVGSQYTTYSSNENAVLPIFGAQTGVMVRFSIYDFVSRKNVMDKSRWAIEEAKFRTDQQRVVIRQLVVHAYQQAVLNQELMRVTNERVQAALSHQEMADREFKSGDIPISELSRVTQILGQAKTELAKAKAEFFESYYQLEVLIGKKLTEL